MKVTIGGDRLGSGQKMKVDLRTYNRSTHNLSAKFASTMGCGILYPCLKKLVLKGDSWHIKTQAGARTLPTKAPLFGSYKMQMDYFFVPFRLYQAILHNNPTNIGLKMNQVKLPKLRVFTRINGKNDFNASKFSNSCLLKYLGMSGLGIFDTPETKTDRVARDIAAVPALGYYDIFKTYYANKQEEDAYYVSSENTIVQKKQYMRQAVIQSSQPYENIDTYQIYKNQMSGYIPANPTNEIRIIFYGTNVNELYKNATYLYRRIDDTEGAQMIERYTYEEFLDCILAHNGTYEIDDSLDNEVTIIINGFETYDNYYLEIGLDWENKEERKEDKLIIKPFKLANIDEMRMRILSDHQLGHTFLITRTETLQPYKDLVDLQYDPDGTQQEGITKNANPLNGLVLKTYQSDLFNSWVNTEWIDGENGIAELTKIAVTDGAIKIDDINLSEKLYNVLNRIAVSDGTFESWEDVVYTETSRRYHESPIYLGGMSNEIVFEEIVQTAPGEDSELGSLAGKGVMVKRKGGEFSFKVDTAGYIIGIASITPRIYYTQGNDFDLTDIDTLDDLHKPALDGIGFQNLIGERMAWFDTKLDSQGQIKSRSVVGKVPAWIEYMTNVDTAYGEFVDIEPAASMILNRNYSMDENGDVADFTTYIDPTKYNYAFAYNKLDAQNFWVQIYHELTPRRLMSAKQIPNV